MGDIEDGKELENLDEPYLIQGRFGRQNGEVRNWKYRNLGVSR